MGEVSESTPGNPYLLKKFIRGFLLSKKEETVNPRWIKTMIGDWHITYDSANRFSVSSSGPLYVAILGYAIDTDSETTDSDIICDNLLDSLSDSKDAFYDCIDALCGRFVIFYYDKESDGLAVTLDATGTRSVFYSVKDDVVASHYSLIQMVTGDEKSELYAFYRSMKNRPWILPGDYSPFENIFGLSANHEFLTSSKTIRRIWPRKPLASVSINTATDEIHRILKKEADLIAKDHPNIALSLTGGKDSRLSLSLFREHKGQITCFTNSSRTAERVKDVTIARHVSEDNGVRYEPLDMENVDISSKEYKDFWKVCDTNHYHEHMRRGVYLSSKRFEGYLHIQSNLVEIMGHRVTFDSVSDSATYKKVSGTIYPDCEEEIVLEAFRSYFERNEMDNRMGHHLNDLLYWEYRMSHWLNAACITENDMAFDTIQLMNCRKVLEMGVSVPMLYRKDNVIADTIVYREWPELVDHVPNLDYSISDYLPVDNAAIEFKNLSPSVRSETGNDAYCRVGAYSCDFGFASSPSKDEKVELEMRFTTRNKGAYYIQVCVTCPSRCRCSREVVYNVKLDGEIVYSTDMWLFYDRVNTIDIAFVSRSRDHRLSIEIVSDGNASGLSCPFLHVGPFQRIAINNFDSEIPMVTSSKSAYQQARRRLKKTGELPAFDE
ncbi:MAG: hypothetical protein IKR86_11500 [Candidatus Methanomethylophilaceae archaeon]|nr:hypothetical protein [Candidatus Methanomethylophilaceae archaeon]